MLLVVSKLHSLSQRGVQVNSRRAQHLRAAACQPHARQVSLRLLAVAAGFQSRSHRLAAAELNVDVWALALEHVLHEPGRSRFHQPLGRASATLALAIRLASVCKLWRCAAVQATQRVLQPDLNPCAGMEPRFLSPLLADLVAGRRTLSMACPLQAAPRAPAWIERAGPGKLTIEGTSHRRVALGAGLACCKSLGSFHCLNVKLPSFPPNLHTLCVDYTTGFQRGSGRKMLRDLPRLTRLEHLTLLCANSAALPDHIPYPASLRFLTLSTALMPGDSVGSLAALCQAAEQGVSTQLGVGLDRHL